NTDDINELIFTSGIGNEIISKKEKLVGKFIITSTEDISVENLNLLWNFSGSVNTILTDPNFQDITVPSNHKSFYDQVTNIENVENIPNNFELSQNYPNPFNPTTKINFTLPEKGFVKLTIYNMIGEKVMNVLNESISQGSHTVEINASHLASGVYVYSINVAGKYSAVKKMMLLK
ncbi:MAG: T9SS type A sorting domain-containing protein, partial [Ignavibacteriae bacterium]|nr:T9SS type A sorting domain-containing protein [Ignavibacteriota bacterium]